MNPLLQTHDLKAWYGDAQALFGVDFHIDAGEVVAIIGANGAGKSTFLKALTGMVKVPADAIRFQGKDCGGLPSGQIAKLGIAMVPEGRRLFPSLNVEENLMMGAFSQRSGPWNLERVYRLFPVLKQRRSYPVTQLSGGQQQMVAMGRALMGNPSLLLCDELSLGLAPVIIKTIYDAMDTIIGDGMSVVIVEQDVTMAQKVSDRVYCFQEGTVALQGKSDEVTREQIHDAYFGS